MTDMELSDRINAAAAELEKLLDEATDEFQSDDVPEHLHDLTEDASLASQELSGELRNGEQIERVIDTLIMLEKAYAAEDASS